MSWARVVGENGDVKPRLLRKSRKRAGKRSLLSFVRRRKRSLHSGTYRSQHCRTTWRTTFPKEPAKACADAPEGVGCTRCRTLEESSE